MAQKSTLTLFRGSPPLNAYVWSPFVNKVEARLRFASQPYILEHGSPRAAPKGKIPYITLTSDNGASNSLGDSNFIIKHLVADGTLPDLNGAITPVQRAQDLAIRAMMEDRAYFFSGKEKWVDNYETMRDGVLGSIPWPMRLIIGYLAQRANLRTFYGQGVLRHSDEELKELKEEVWESVDALLAEARQTGAGSDKPFWVLGGQQPTEADATLFGFIAGTLVCNAAPQMMGIVKQHPVVLEYAQRIHDAYFPDYECWQ